MQRVGEIFGEQIFNAFANRRVATKIQDVFERGVQTRDTTVEIDREQSDVDRFDNRFVELFQHLQLRGTFLLILVEQAVLDRDCNVAGDGPQDLYVFR